MIFGIVPHLVRPQAAALAHDLIASLRSRGHHVRVPAADAVKAGLDEWAVPEHEFGPGLALAFSLGGDGTMLRTVELVAPHDVPVIGVNVGHLGYLTSLQPSELAGALDRLLTSAYEIEVRMTLAVTVDAGHGETAYYLALNDAVFERASTGHTVRLGVAFNSEPFLDYTADGLIIATPTGSTAYAFSARGPIVSPLLNALVLVPIAPHMLFDRPLVLDPDEPVDVTVLDGLPASLYIDGRHAGLLSEGSRVRVVAGQHPARLVTLNGRRFHTILKNKFGLGTTGLSEPGFGEVS